MDVPAALAADLEALTYALDEPGADLETQLRALAADARRAVDSYLGLTITLVIDGHPITLTTMDSIDVRASLCLPLNVLCAAAPGSTLVLYAAQPGAFVDLAADLTFAFRLSPDTVALDGDLRPPGPPDGVSGLQEMSHINQAIGILIGHGHLPDGARTELQRRADHAQITVHAAAQQLIRTSLTPPAADQLS